MVFSKFSFYLKRYPFYTSSIINYLLTFCILIFVFLFFFHFRLDFSTVSAIHFDRWAVPAGSPALDCARVFANDKQYIGEMTKNRIRIDDDPPENALDMQCAAIQRRNRFGHKRAEEDAHGNYPLAQIRTVYKDYVMVEMELASTFSAHNWYCYVMDSASSALFKRRLHALANCFTNVIIGDQRKMDSSGVGMMEAVLDCFGRLTSMAQQKWEYVSILQNHDTAIKTRVQMAQIFAWMNGANDVDVISPGGKVASISAMDWNFTALNLFKNATLNTASSVSSHGFPARLLLSKGYFQVSLTRAMVEFIGRELNLTELVRRINLIGYGRDEILLTTLHSADQLNAPGGFTQTCFNPKSAGRTNHLTRETFWMPNPNCASGHAHHSICLFGIEDLPRLAKLPHLFVNKFWPSFDFGAVICMYEHIFNMTHLHTNSEQLDKLTLTKSDVEELPNVRFQRFKKNMMGRQQQQQGIMNDHQRLSHDEVMGFQCVDE